MSRISAIAATAFFCLLLAACGRPTHHYTDTKDVKIDSISHAEDGEFLIVTAVLVNDDDGAVRHSVYRMQWFAGTGPPLEHSSWRPVVVTGGATGYVQ